jgi:hypothetical protein
VRLPRFLQCLDAVFRFFDIVSAEAGLAKWGSPLISRTHPKRPILWPEACHGEQKEGERKFSDEYKREAVRLATELPDLATRPTAGS